MKPSEKRIGVVPVLGIAAAGPPPACGLHFSAYDLAQNAMREKQAMRKIMKTTFSIARMYRSDKFAAR
jgi:hypothetical protein